MGTLTDTVVHLKDTLAERRAQRRERAALERELASYATPAERTELELLLGQYSEEETRPVREILDRLPVRRAA